MYNMHDENILKILKAEEERQRSTLEMIASENFTSAEVMIVQVLFLQTNMRRAIHRKDTMVAVNSLMRQRS